MIYGYLGEGETYELLTRLPMWDLAFEWIRKMPSMPELGIHQIIDDMMFANIMKYGTVDRTEARFETHRTHIDLQFTISGAELIDWRLANEMRADGPFVEEKDLQFYLPEETQSTVHMRPGHFAIFFPQDAHRPKVKDERFGEVYKGVIKINRKLLNP